jgi:hypothetical protein
MALALSVQSAVDVCQRLLQLLSEDDDTLLRTLQQLMLTQQLLQRHAGSAQLALQAETASLSRKSARAETGALRETAALFLVVFPPYALLHAFLQLLAFDTSALLDLLLADEATGCCCLHFLHAAVRWLADCPAALEQLHADSHAQAELRCSSATPSARPCAGEAEGSEAAALAQPSSGALAEPEESSATDVSACLHRLGVALARLQAKVSAQRCSRVR